MKEGVIELYMSNVLYYHWSLTVSKLMDPCSQMAELTASQCSAESITIIMQCIDLKHK